MGEGSTEDGHYGSDPADGMTLERPERLCTPLKGVFTPSSKAVVRACCLVALVWVSERSMLAGRLGTGSQSGDSGSKALLSLGLSPAQLQVSQGPPLPWKPY